MSAVVPDASASVAEVGELRSAVSGIRDLLLRARQRLDAEIGAYPTPIPRCDAQFNHVYDERMRVLAALREATSALDLGTQAAMRDCVSRYLCAAPVTTEPGDDALRARLRGAKLR